MLSHIDIYSYLISALARVSSSHADYPSALLTLYFVVLLYWGSFSGYYIYKYLLVLFDPFCMRAHTHPHTFP